MKTENDLIQQFRSYLGFVGWFEAGRMKRDCVYGEDRAPRGGRRNLKKLKIRSVTDVEVPLLPFTISIKNLYYIV